MILSCFFAGSVPFSDDGAWRKCGITEYFLEMAWNEPENWFCLRVLTENFCLN